MNISGALSITVLDVNDEDPVFDQQLYTFVVYENLTMGAQVIAVLAVDGDHGINDDILYSITNGTRSLMGLLVSLSTKPAAG